MSAKSSNPLKFWGQTVSKDLINNYVQRFKDHTSSDNLVTNKSHDEIFHKFKSISNGMGHGFYSFIE
jgi:hypothetical protein